MSKNQTTQIKAILCLLVIFGHSMNSYLECVGNWAVSLFFFLSGFALALTTDGKPTTSKLLKHKFSSIIFPYLIVACFYHLLFWKYPSSLDYNSIKGLIEGYLYFTPTVQAGWYIEVTVIFFVAYFLIKKLAKDNPKFILLGLAVVYVILAVYTLIYSESYWVIRNVQCFILGVGYHFYRSKIEKNFIKKDSFRMLSLVTIMLSILIPYLCSSKEGILIVCAYGVLYTAAPIVLLFICMNYKAQNPVLMFLGKYSLWMYLFHVGVQYWFINGLVPGSSWHPLLFFVISVALTMVIAIPVGMIYEVIKNEIHKRCSGNNKING